MPLRAAVFDLDGTLLDSLADIAHSMNFVLEEMGFSAHPLKDYRAFVGDGITMLARRALPADRRDDATLADCVERMRRRYRDHSEVLTRPYEGMSELLDGLTERGLAMAVLSNKPHELTVALVEGLLGRWSFRPVLGERPGVARKPDPAAVFEILRELGLSADEAVYVGDTPTDLATARAAGMRCIAAAWGFRGAEELRAAGAQSIAASPVEVLDLL